MNVASSLLMALISSLVVLSPIAIASVRASENAQPLRLIESTEPIASEDGLSSLLGLDDQLWGTVTGIGDRQALLSAIEHSLSYLNTPEATAAYAQYPVPDFTLDRVRRSLERFRQLLLNSRSAAELQAAVQREFDFYQSVGTGGQGTVSFTGYFEPVYQASRFPTNEFRYPLYRLPPDLESWQQPHPTRIELEGMDGQGGATGRLQGLEIVWLRDRMEAYLVQVQGSAQLQFPDGTRTSVGYAGRTEYPYVSIGRELVNAGKFREDELSLPRVIEYFQTHPAELDHYLTRNNRFVFFHETNGSPAIGNLNVPVTADRSIATDKSLMPPGALALIQTQIPVLTAEAELVSRSVSRYVLDQDTGGAIQGAGRVDIFMGTGELAGDRAGLVNTTGQLYYLLLKN